MSQATFTVVMLTPAKKYTREVSAIRLRDASGYFGIMRGHEDFLTVLVPSLGYYNDSSGREVFIAVDGGVFIFRDGAAILTSRELFESDDAERLSALIEEARSKRTEEESGLSAMLEGIERSFMEKSFEMMRGKA